MESICKNTTSFVVASVTTLAAISFVTYLHKSRYKLWKDQKVNGPKQWPIFGNISEMMFSKSFLDSMDQRYKDFGPVYGVYLFFKPQLVVGDVDMLKDILVRDWHVFADRMSGLKTGDDVADSFLISVSGLMTDNIEKRIQEQAREMYELDMRHLAGCYSMDVIAKCCFGTDTNSFNDPNNVFVTQAHKFFNISKLRLLFSIILFLLPMWVRKMAGFKGTHKESTEFFISVSKAILDQRRRGGHDNDQLGGAKDYLQLLIDASKEQNSNSVSNGHDESVPDHESHHGHEEINEKANQTMVTNEMKRPLTDNEIIASSVLFLAVGYDTTGSLITMATYLLTCNQDAQLRLREELKSAQVENGGKLNYETISGLKYLDAVISETLRLLPSACLSERKAMEEYTFQKNGIKVPKGTSIVLPIWNIHHDPNYWKNPDKFDPERFLPENRDKIIPYSYIPFGGGPRNCVGMRFALLEAKLAIANLVLNFKFTPCSRTDIPLDLTPTRGLINPKRVFVGVQKSD